MSINSSGNSGYGGGLDAASLLFNMQMNYQQTMLRQATMINTQRQMELQYQQQPMELATAQMAMMAPMEGSQMSSGANALMLLMGVSQILDSMMGQNIGLPPRPNFGDDGCPCAQNFQPRGAFAEGFPNYGPSNYNPQGFDPRDFDPGDFNTPQGPGGHRPRTGTCREGRVIRQNTGGAKVRPLAQSNGSSCGQTSAAMCINSLTGKKLSDRDINSRYGYSLLGALNGESRSSGYQWKDAGNLSAKSWPSLEKRLNQEKTPVMIGLNGQFSPSGRGHIVTLMSIKGDVVTYADPADGKIKTTSKQAIENAPPHPDGKFMFVASKA